MSSPFKITRADGRSNQQVILDYVKDGAAGHVYSYDELAQALSVGSNHAYSLREVQGVVAHALVRMLKEQARILHNVRHVGYRLAPGSYHLTLAGERQEKADKQMLRGLQTLQHVRWEEMTPNERLAHQGQLLISGALYQQMKAIERRQTAIEESISRAIGSSITPEADGTP